MIDSKKIDFIAIAAAVLAVLLVIAMIIFGREYVYTPEYAKTVFGADIITIDIQADVTEWQDMLDNAINEEYIMADVAVNGKKYSYVGVRPKGNNSLQQVYSSDSDRYSFKIKFDEYAEGQTCGGLDMLVLNDMLGDATYMKEYTAFEMMRELGIETPYFGYAKITVNGEDWGLYFALEAYNDSYLQRVSGNENGMLYNVKSADMNGGQAEPATKTDLKNSPQRGFGGHGGMGAANSGGSLVYTDDSSSSYSAIFGNAVGGGGSEEDYSRVIAALKALSDGENIEEYFDVDEILRYLAVHSFVVNLDSYSSNMAQNYYIYEQDGVIKILPWDYNYAWGAFQGGTASSTVNFPADTPVSGVEMSERPLISVLLGNAEYLERYHNYLNELLEKYFTDGKFDNRLDELDNLIGGYVQADPTAFYTYDEYKTAVEAFKTLGSLRAESVSGQLDGTVPSTTEEQKENPDKLVDAGSVKMSDLGMSNMGGGRDFGGERPDSGGDGNFGGFGMRNPPSGNMPSGDMPQFDGNNAPPDLPDGDNFGDNTESNVPQALPNLPNGNNNENNTESNVPQTPPNLPDSNNNENNTESNGTKVPPQMPDSNNFGNNTEGNDMRPTHDAPAEENSGFALNVGSLVLLIAATVGVSLVRSKF